MIGLDADPIKDQESMDASKIASDMLDAPSACRTKRGSVKRRKSALLGLNMEESDSSDEESNKKNHSRKNSTRRKSNYGDTGDADEPSGMSLLNHRPRSSATNSRRGKLKKYIMKQHFFSAVLISGFFNLTRFIILSYFLPV